MRVLKQRYELRAVLGRGGMGVVHRAQDLDLDRAVAVKIVPAESAAARERFIKEAKRTAALRHPGIVEVFDVGHDEADAFLVMELLEGESLSERLEREPRMTIDEAIDLAAAICDALSFAHAAGFVHRDVKPANVFLVERADAMEPKLLDFGVAKRIDGSTASESQGWAGTLTYMAPEQIKGERVDGRTDLYALGLVLYRLLAGKMPFEAENAAAMVHQHLTKEPPSIRASNPEVRRALEAAVMRMLAKDPRDRFVDAASAKAALLGAITGPDLERAIDGEEARSIDLELDRREPEKRPSRAPAHPIATVLPLAAIEEAAPVAEPELMPWMARVPAAVSKRVGLYSAIAFVANLVLFPVGLITALLALLAIAGGVLYWSALRAGRA